MTPRAALAVCVALAAVAVDAHAHGRATRSAPPALAHATAPAIAAACAQRSWKREPGGHLRRDDCVGQLVREPAAAPADVRKRQSRIAVALPQSALANTPVADDDFGED